MYGLFCHPITSRRSQLFKYVDYHLLFFLLQMMYSTFFLFLIDCVLIILQSLEIYYDDLFILAIYAAHFLSFYLNIYFPLTLNILFKSSKLAANRILHPCSFKRDVDFSKDAKKL